MSRPAGRMRALVAVTGAVLLLLTGAASATAAAPAQVGAGTRGVAVLNGIVEALNRHGGPGGTAWGVDETADQVVLYVESTAAEAPTRALLRYAATFGGAVRVQRLLSEPDPAPAAAPLAPTPSADSSVAAVTLRAGDGVYGVSGLGSPVTCSSGFNVITSTPLPPPPYAANRILMSGQCTGGYPAWYLGNASGPFLGYTSASNFPRTDYGVVGKASGVSAISSVNLYNGTTRPIYSSGDAYKNRSVCASGVGSRYRCGVITAVNLTVNYCSSPYSCPVYGLAAGSFCSVNSDRGGPVFDGNTAVGLVSGRAGSCSFLRITYIQPIGPVMSANKFFFPPAGQ